MIWSKWMCVCVLPIPWSWRGSNLCECGVNLWITELPHQWEKWKLSALPAWRVPLGRDCTSNFQGHHKFDQSTVPTAPTAPFLEYFEIAPIFQTFSDVSADVLHLAAWDKSSRSGLAQAHGWEQNLQEPIRSLQSVWKFERVGKMSCLCLEIAREVKSSLCQSISRLKTDTQAATQADTQT